MQIKEYTSAQAASRLGVTTRTVARLYARGYFPNARKHLVAYEQALANGR